MALACTLVVAVLVRVLANGKSGSEEPISSLLLKPPLYPVPAVVLGMLRELYNPLYLKPQAGCDSLERHSISAHQLW